MRNKDLSRYLSGKIYMDWKTRLKITTKAAEGLCYLHHECSPPLVHRDIKDSSILLDDDFEVRLGSLTRPCIEEENNNPDRSSGFLRLPMISGSSEQTKYGTWNAACAGNVYSFGKVLLELVSGRLGIISAANNSTMKDWMANTLRCIVSEKKVTIDPSLDDDILVDAQAVAFIAKACLGPEATKRPKMASIVKALKCVNRV